MHQRKYGLTTTDAEDPRGHRTTAPISPVQFPATLCSKIPMNITNNRLFTTSSDTHTHHMHKICVVFIMKH